MGYEVKIVKDSVGPNGIRLATIEATYPLIVHNELMTHRVLSRNTASNRAIPVEKMIDSVMRDPFIPEVWPMNQKGMQATEYFKGDSIETLRRNWLLARDAAVAQAETLRHLGVHKQITNRLLAPWLYTTAVITATHWANFLNLRCHPAAQPEMKQLADMIQMALFESTPQELEEGQWHTPYVGEVWKGPVWGLRPTGVVLPHVVADHEGYTETGFACLVSAGRCAGVSYLRQGEQKTGADAFDLAFRLTQNGHWSPFEHQAQARAKNHYDWSGNFFGWTQLRKMFVRENQLIFQPNLPTTKGQRPMVNVS